MTDDLVSWLSKEYQDRGWSMRFLAERIGVSHSTVSNVLNYKQRPTWDFCAGVAKALGMDVDDVFILAGLKQAPPPAVEGEGEALNLLRQLPEAMRTMIFTMLRALAGRPAYNAVAEAHEPYQVARTESERQLLEMFRETDDRWREIILEDMKALRQNRLVRFIGEEEQPRSEQTAAIPPGRYSANETA